MHIVDMVYFWARTMPQHPAVIQPDGIVTYRALAQGIERAAEHFAGNIPDKSKPVTVSLPSAAKMLIASLGLLRAAFSIIVAGKKELRPHSARRIRIRWFTSEAKQPWATGPTSFSTNPGLKSASARRGRAGR